MTFGILALALAAPAASSAVPAPGLDTAPRAMQQLLQSCEAHKFETTITVMDEAGPRSSKVRLCGTQGQTDEAWLRTLNDAVEKTAANTDVPPAVRDQIVGALKAEIARLVPPPAAKVADVPQTMPPARPLQQSHSLDYSALPPLPDSPQVPAVAKVVAATTQHAPRLTVRCVTPGDPSDIGLCEELGRDTMLLIKADQALADKVSLRFVRRGTPRGEIQLAPLGQGQSVQVRMPTGVCAGVIRSRVQIEIVGRDGATDMLGPFDLRC
jgi:hypothetical protein